MTIRYDCNGGEMMSSGSGEYVEYDDYVAREEYLEDTIHDRDAEINELKQKVEDLSYDLQKANETIANKDAEIYDLERVNSDLEAEVDCLNTDILSLETEIEKLKEELAGDVGI